MFDLESSHYAIELAHEHRSEFEQADSLFVVQQQESSFGCDYGFIVERSRIECDDGRGLLRIERSVEIPAPLVAGRCWQSKPVRLQQDRTDAKRSFHLRNYLIQLRVRQCDCLCGNNSAGRLHRAPRIHQQRESFRRAEPNSQSVRHWISNVIRGFHLLRQLRNDDALISTFSEISNQSVFDAM